MELTESAFFKDLALAIETSKYLLCTFFYKNHSKVPNELVSSIKLSRDNDLDGNILLNSEAFDFEKCHPNILKSIISRKQPNISL